MFSQSVCWRVDFRSSRGGKGCGEEDDDALVDGSGWVYSMRWRGGMRRWEVTWMTNRVVVAVVVTL